MSFTYTHFLEVQVHFFQRVGDQAVGLDFYLAFQLIVGLIRLHMYNFTDDGCAGYGDGYWFNFILKCQANFSQRHTHSVEVGDLSLSECLFNNWLAGKRG